MAQQHATPGAVIDLNTFGEGKTTAIVKEDTFEAIRLIVEPGKPIPPHKVNGPISVQCLRGSCTFSIGNEPRKLVGGSWLYLAGGQMHAVESEEGAVLLVTILFKNS